MARPRAVTQAVDRNGLSEVSVRRPEAAQCRVSLTPQLFTRLGSLSLGGVGVVMAVASGLKLAVVARSTVGYAHYWAGPRGRRTPLRRAGRQGRTAHRRDDVLDSLIPALAALGRSPHCFHAPWWCGYLG